MKLRALFALLGTISLISCEENVLADSSITQRTSLPGPDRARAAAEHVRTALERDLTALGLKFGDPVFIRAFKQELQLEVFVLHRTSGKYALFRTYPIAGSSGVLGPKMMEGDGQVPEGFYFVPPAAMKNDSQFHLSFNLGYPNEFDRAHQRTGSAIMIHGNCVSIGCLAMTDEKIEEIFTLCAAAHAGGQAFFRVHVFPFRMNDETMKQASENPHEDFWKNLREGYDHFENTGLPPNVSVIDGRYHFTDS